VGGFMDDMMGSLVDDLLDGCVDNLVSIFVRDIDFSKDFGFFE